MFFGFLRFFAGVRRFAVEPSGSLERRRVGHMLFRRWVGLRSFHVLFIVLNLADWILTWIILAALGAEANPLAAWLLQKSGFVLAAYKFGLTALVVVVIEVIHEARPRTARRVAITGVIIMTLVVARSLWMVAENIPFNELSEMLGA